MSDAAPRSGNHGIMAWQREQFALQRAGLALEIVVSYQAIPWERRCADCGNIMAQPGTLTTVRRCGCPALTAGRDAAPTR